MKRELEPQEKEEIKGYLSMNDSELYRALAKTLSPQAKQVFGDNDDDDAASATGQAKMEEWRRAIFEKVCVKWECCKKLKDPQLSDKVALIGSVGDVIATAGLGVPPFMVATILFRIGLSKFCECELSEDKKA